MVNYQIKARLTDRVFTALNEKTKFPETNFYDKLLNQCSTDESTNPKISINISVS